MKVAIASSNGKDINLHFGHAETFYIYTINNSTPELVETRSVSRFCTPESNHGKNNGVFEKFIALLGDCDILLCESIGYHVAKRLESEGIRPYMLECDIETGLSAVSSGVLESIAIY